MGAGAGPEEGSGSRDGAEWREAPGADEFPSLLFSAAYVRRGHCCASQGPAPSPVAGLPGPPGLLVIAPVALE